MKPGPLYDRAVDVMKEMIRFTRRLRDRADGVVDRYNEWKTSFSLPRRMQ